METMLTIGIPLPIESTKKAHSLLSHCTIYTLEAPSCFLVYIGTEIMV